MILFNAIQCLFFFYFWKQSSKLYKEYEKFVKKTIYMYSLGFCIRCYKNEVISQLNKLFIYHTAIIIRVRLGFGMNAHLQCFQY